MSGSSMDGLDIVAVTLSYRKTRWSYVIHHAITVPYPQELLESLSHAAGLSGKNLALLHHAYGTWTGNEVNRFIERHHFIPELIASHGHTVFHDPAKHLTFQLGDGNAIAAATGITTVWDFRSLDVAMGGQGAPLVPAGDVLLFEEYSHCINLGGFANLSFDLNGKRIAYDPCPANLAMQHIVRPLGLEFDQDGRLGRKGTVSPDLLEELDTLDFYRIPPPKSLGREWLFAVFYPVLDRFELSAEDKLRTVYEHIARQISVSVKQVKGDKALLTGGGARNTFLVERISSLSPVKIVVPDQTIVDYKEALIFALLGVLRLRNEMNCFASVTGASRDLSTGSIVMLNR